MDLAHHTDTRPIPHPELQPGDDILLCPELGSLPGHIMAEGDGSGRNWGVTIHYGHGVSALLIVNKADVRPAGDLAQDSPTVDARASDMPPSVADAMGDLAGSSAAEMTPSAERWQARKNEHLARWGPAIQTLAEELRAYQWPRDGKVDTRPDISRAAMLHGMAENVAYSTGDRLTAALEALNIVVDAMRREAAGIPVLVQAVGDTAPARDGMLPILHALSELRRLYADDLGLDEIALAGRERLKAVLDAYDQWVQGR